MTPPQSDRKSERKQGWLAGDLLGTSTTFLSEPKIAVRRLEWQRRPSAREAQWFEAVSPISHHGVIHEHTVLRLQWRPAGGARLEAFNAAVHLFGQRIYAIDYDPDKTHLNKVGVGRPYFRKMIGPGTHIHTPSRDGLGYAEPVDEFSSFERLFQHLVTSANLDVPGGFPHTPPFQISLLP